MTLFKKKNKPSYIQVLLEEKYKQTKQENKTYFYFALFDRDKPDAENFCKKNGISMKYLNASHSLYEKIDDVFKLTIDYFEGE